MKSCPTCNNTFEEPVRFCPHDGEALRESVENIVGRVLDGKYKVESFITQGGMGAVYRARHILLGDRVVIKTLRTEMRDNAELVRRFQREGRAARAFSHPNAVTVYDLSTASDGLIYLVMEYVEGQTLASELKEHGRFAPAEAVDILAPVADVLDAAHACGVVHRDLKPENVMLSEASGGRRSVKVLDLGIAKLVEMPDMQGGEIQSLTVAGQILGSPHYMSPEQWGELALDGKPEVDARTDIYSLGVMFFELVAGRKPHNAHTLPELRQQHVSSERPLLHKVVAGVPEAFGRAVARAMARDRDDRQQTAGKLIAELRAATNATSKRSATVGDETAATLIDETAPTLMMEAEIPSNNAGAHKATARRWNAPLMIGGALVLLLLAGAVGLFAWNRMKERASDEASLKPTASPASAVPAPALVRILSYWVEAFGQTKKDGSKRLADSAIPLVSGQNYKFYFKPSERGYLYIIGQAKNGNAPITFLTALGDDLRKTNLASRNAEFDFPYQGRLKLDKNPGTEEFTVVFSPTPLLSPTFLTEKYGHVLTPAEVKEFDDLRLQHKISDMRQSVQTENNEAAVVVSVPDGMQNQPLIFVIPIEHK